MLDHSFDWVGRPVSTSSVSQVLSLPLDHIVLSSCPIVDGCLDAFFFESPKETRTPDRCKDSRQKHKQPRLTREDHDPRRSVCLVFNFLLRAAGRCRCDLSKAQSLFQGKGLQGILGHAAAVRSFFLSVCAIPVCAPNKSETGNSGQTEGKPRMGD